MLLDSSKFSNYSRYSFAIYRADTFRSSIDLIIFTGLLNGTLRESAKRARLELTQSGRLERTRGFYRSFTARDFTNRCCFFFFFVFLAAASIFLVFAWNCIGEVSSRCSQPTLLYHTRRVFFPAYVSPHSCLGEQRKSSFILRYRKREILIDAHRFASIYIAPRFHKTHNFFYFLDSSEEFEDDHGWRFFYPAFKRLTTWLSMVALDTR